MYWHWRDESNAPEFSICACILDTGLPLNVRSFSSFRQFHIRSTIDRDTSRPNSCHERTVRWNSLRLSGYASLALIRHWTIFLLLLHQ